VKTGMISRMRRDPKMTIGAFESNFLREKKFFAVIGQIFGRGTESE